MEPTPLLGRVKAAWPIGRCSLLYTPTGKLMAHIVACMTGLLLAGGGAFVLLVSARVIDVLIRGDLNG